ncbi:MAG TPA: DUF1330 domain-containing protein, partial [Xanthobacteraceae bacterium]|nr:DUF1330 domain-containing protein [Xanthobacteraceae bacterium]
MGKGYWVTFYRAIKDADAVAAYAEAGGAAIVAAGGRILARGVAAQTYEAGLKQRMVVIEFPSVAAAIACYNCEAYQASLKFLG